MRADRAASAGSDRGRELDRSDLDRPGLDNEIAIFPAELGEDIWEALDAAPTKPLGFTQFNAGPGVGGHRPTIDPSCLSLSVRTTVGGSSRFAGRCGRRAHRPPRRRPRIRRVAGPGVLDTRHRGRCEVTKHL